MMRLLGMVGDLVVTVEGCGRVVAVDDACIDV